MRSVNYKRTKAQKQEKNFSQGSIDLKHRVGYNKENSIVQNAMTKKVNHPERHTESIPRQ
ncbi:hypothetical protein A7X67_15080 [Clostridium sp. W14A]|nr:hypothetical protein A7X67_15080 [Clostridium sp. W14A]